MHRIKPVALAVLIILVSTLSTAQASTAYTKSAEPSVAASVEAGGHPPMPYVDPHVRVSGPGDYTHDVTIRGTFGEYVLVRLSVQVTYLDPKFMRIGQIRWSYYGWGKTVICGGSLQVYDIGEIRKSNSKINPLISEVSDTFRCWSSKGASNQWNLATQFAVNVPSDVWFRGGGCAGGWPGVSVYKVVSPGSPYSVGSVPIGMDMVHARCG